MMFCLCKVCERPRIVGLFYPSSITCQTDVFQLFKKSKSGILSITVVDPYLKFKWKQRVRWGGGIP